MIDIYSIFLSKRKLREDGGFTITVNIKDINILGKNETRGPVV
jgi:hypothetical protein